MSVESTHLLNKLSFEVKSRKFTVNTDVVEKLGGDDSAPDPHQYLEIALASCTSITVMMYAKRKGIPLDDINVSIHITAEGEVNAISRGVQLIGNLTQEQKDSLIAIAEKCPIHRILSRGAQITTTLKEA
ncbi:MAG: OsmC family protein [Pseudobdellovibrio sp.]|nr:OsmC family protein [Pseudobdellovibrio sp.]